MRYNIKETTSFLAEFIGVETKAILMSANKTKGLPMVLSNSYCFYTICLYDSMVVLALALEPERCTPLQLRKHQNILEDQLNLPVVFVLASVESYNLKRISKAGINFIVPGKIIYAPCLMMLLRNLPNPRNEIKETMPPVAQLLVLYHLQKEQLNGYDAYRLAEITGMAYTTIIKAINWLKANDIITLSTTKQKYIQFTTEGNELWNKTVSLMSSPIERIVFADDMPIGVTAGETAMGAYTMLAEPNVPVVAISKPEAKEYEAILNKQYGNIKIEVWKYNPVLLADGDKVDRLSLYLSLKDSSDERTRMECDTLIEDMKW